MEQFKGYLGALQRVNAQTGYRPVHDYFLRRRPEVARLATRLNEEASLTKPEQRFQPDLPLLGLGSWKGVVLVSANPGWRERSVDPRNHLEEEFRSSSAAACHAFAEDFFEVHHRPDVLGKKLRFWSRPIALLELLGWANVRRAAGLEGDGPPQSTVERWRLAHEARLLGGWELLPWHSQADGFSLRTTGGLFRRLCEESLQAAIRIQPKYLVVASKAGYDLMRHELLRGASWVDDAVNGVNVSRAIKGSTVVLAVARQMFARGSPLGVSEVIRAEKRLSRRGGRP